MNKTPQEIAEYFEFADWLNKNYTDYGRQTPSQEQVFQEWVFSRAKG